MRIAVLMGSPRKKDSFAVCKQIEKLMNLQGSNIEFDYIFIKDYHIKDCKGCSLCFQKSENDCPCRDDDLNNLKERLFSADGLIIASPVYAYQVTGQLKRFIDRMSYLFHRQEMVGMPSIIVVTTDGGGSKQVHKYLKMTMSGWGLNIVGNLQIRAPMYFENRMPKSDFGYDEYYFEKQNKKVNEVSVKFLESIISADKRCPTFYDIFMFNCLRSKTYIFEADRVYWEKKGWLNSCYFYDAKLNLIKKIFGALMKSCIHTILIFTLKTKKSSQ